MLYFIDLFCGAGGTTSGIHRAQVRGKIIAKVIACVNHDANAIKSHYLNNPNVKHFTEDIRILDISPLIELIMSIRAKDPQAIICLWASLECTNFSNAKGGMSRDADSRTLAEHLFRYIEGISFDYVFIENVREFEKWGPLKVLEKKHNKKQKIKYAHCPLHFTRNKKKKVISFGPTWIPIKDQMGIYYDAWINKMKSYGYNFERKHMNSADYGAYTSRIRYFAQFSKNDFPIAWPEPTHSKTQMAGKKKWKPVKDVLDLQDHGESIFRKPQLSDKTYERIYHGMIKFIAGGMQPFESFVMRYYSGDPEHRVHSIHEPAGTVTTNNRMALATVKFLVQRNGGNPKSKSFSTDRPARTVTKTGGNQSVVSPEFLIKHFSGDPYNKSQSTDEPAGSITTKDHHAVVNTDFISTYHGNGIGAHSLDGPAPTIPTKDSAGLIQPQFFVNYHHSSVVDSISKPAPTLTCKDKLGFCTPKFIMRDFTSGTFLSSLENPVGSIMPHPKMNIISPFLMRDFKTPTHSSTDTPAGSLTTNPKMNLISSEWIMDTQYGNVGQPLTEPAHTITANRKHFYLMNLYAWGGKGTQSIERPSFTLIARMDKAPPYLIEVEGGQIGIRVYKRDSKHIILIKEFMAMFGIIDVKMRMLKILELLKIQGFITADHPVYDLIGTQEEQKKYIGNSCEVNNVKSLIEATFLSIKTYKQNRKAA